MTILIAGYGYMGSWIAKHYLAQGRSVLALSRHSETPPRDERFTWTSTDFDNQLSFNLTNIEPYDVFYLAPPPNVGDTDARVSNFLGAIEKQRPRRVVYMSTTAVYGNADGQWIDETSPINPQTARGKRRLDAENQIEKWCNMHGVEWVILRVTGIYGPGKLPIDRLRAPTPIIRLDQAPPSNRIHAEDLTTVCIAAMENAPTRSIYNVSDGHPTSMSDYFMRIARLAGLPEPVQLPIEEAKSRFSPNMLEFMTETKRVSNAKLIKELNIQLRFADVEEGLKQSVTNSQK